jgi:uncharacterized membrane protein
VLAANSSDTVGLTIAVPPDTKPGTYSGQLKATTASVSAPVVVEVV